MLANRVWNAERCFHKEAKKSKPLSEKDIPAIKTLQTEVDAVTQVAAVSRRYDEIKRPYDPRKYRGLELSNGLRVLLVSDPSETTCGASMDVQVGSRADPEDIPGMAHLCEHLLFQGSEKYPMDNGLMNLVKRSGGDLNGHTEDYWTNFHLEVHPKHLKEALDRLIHIFISPLFAEHIISSEIESVDSEFRNYEKNDVRRMVRICRVLSRPGHDFRKFSTGNRQTLLDIPNSKGLRIHDEVVKFFKKHYSSNVMSLCVFGPQSLDELEDLVLSLPLLEIPNRNVKPKVFEHYYYGPEETGYRVDVVPVKNDRYVTVKFIVQHSASHSEIGRICSLLEYEGEGSLAHELKQRGWSHSLNSMSEDLSEMNVRIDLTQEGLDYVEDIVQLLFVYIGMLKRTGPRRVPPSRQSSGTEETSMVDTILLLVREVRNRPLDYSSPKSLEDMPAKSVLEQLTPRNMICFVVAKENSALENLEREQYYGVKYRKAKLDAASLEKFGRTLSGESELFYLPEDDGKSSPTKSTGATGEIEKPHILTSDQFKRIWYVKSSRAERPFTEIHASLTLPRAASDARSQVMADLFTKCFEYQTREEFYAAGTVGFEASVEPHYRGLKLTFSDFDDSICRTVVDYMRRLISFEPEKKVFDIVLDVLKRKLSDVGMEQPNVQAIYLLNYVLTEGIWPNSQLLEASEHVTFEDLVEFVPSLWSALHLEIFARGTLAEDDVLRLSDQFLPESNSRERLLSPDDLAPFRKLKIPAGVSYFYEHKQVTHSNSCVVFCLQVEPGARNCTLLQFLSDMMSVPLLDTMRTKQQLGYGVGISPRKSKLAHCNDLRLTVQGSYDPDFVEGRIEAFLESFTRILMEMSESDFEEYKDAFRRNIEKLNKKSYMQEIESKRFSFDDCQLQAAEYLQIQKEDLIDFYKRKITAGPERRKVSIWVRSATGDKGPRAEGIKSSLEPIGREMENKRFRLENPLEKRFQCLTCGNLVLFASEDLHSRVVKSCFDCFTKGGRITQSGDS
ncbi:hypothetical protein QR680_018242 [Steinernema hermaphroditum]|uniref:Peptidase M16 N-terminal domain-containing protein n=1 Tax=Steinernema hermaphroditum TaxID=289476 RepID=A0AA39LQS5_9BILA|nr:hypothetical protein QR680_018242 [Steinernema hermaphroditum]